MTNHTLIGKKLNEYHILSQLGEGGMSTIYLGLDTSLQRYTAIKVIHTRLQNDPDTVSRFKREAQAVARLDHPNIVRLYRYGQVDDILYMAMQYIEGLDLRVLLHNYQQDGELIPPADAVRIVKEVSLALDYSHQNKVLHRDIKPSNIMLNREGRAILTDFGLALIPEVDTQGKAFGTPQYMSPEQAQSPADVGPQSDLYGVGMLLYEMFTGKLPFYEIENPMEMVATRATTPPPPPSLIQPDINPALEGVILKALSLEPANRYQSGAALISALENSLPSFGTGLNATYSEIAAPEIIEQEPQAVEASFSPAVQPAIIPTPPVQDSVEKSTTPPYRAAAAQGKRSRLPVPLIAVGGCAVLLLLALFLFGGIQFVRSQLQARYQIWMPSTMNSETEFTPNNTGYPDPFDSSEPGSSEEGENEDEDGDSNNQQNRLSLQIVTNGEDSFYLVNVGSTAVPLSSFRFVEGNKTFEGSLWGLDSLAPGQCVSVWKDKGNPGAPDVSCNEVGGRLEQKAKDLFWKKNFDVFFRNNFVTTCSDTGCQFVLPS